MSDWSSEVFLKQIGPLVTIAPELLKLFITSLDDKVLQLQSCALLEQFSLLQNLAHSIKGSAGQVGCAGLAQCALALENAVKLGAKEEMQTAIRLLMIQADADINKIKTFLATMDTQ
ncbi:Hpt domain-containing protein [Alishewanella sp. d11]|uniref:Hpt domain-containing protein n=1 Tax=Alishewanella sp. d11 TaxID=3414030 RepID=UPI003BF892C6